MNKKTSKLIAKAISYKLQGSHPSLQLMLKIAKSADKTDFNVNVVGHYEEATYFKYCGYYQYIELKFHILHSSSEVVLSCLPYDELIEALCLDSTNFCLPDDQVEYFWNIDDRDKNKWQFA